MTSAREALVEAVAARLRDHAPLARCAVFDAPPVRAAVPYAVVDEPVMTDWGTKSWAGCEARVAVVIRDEGERPVRLRTLLGEVEAAMADLPPALAGGWTVARVLPARSRIARGKGEGWAATAEFVVRIWREG